jgi:23S rRNA pseudouridine2605 synthase
MSDPERMRLQKYLSRAGVCSRREAEAWMAQGRVRVNGHPAVSPGIKIDPDTDRIEVDGRAVEPESRRWLLLHKPPGYITTRRDPRGRPTVYELLAEADRTLRYVGRLDRDTEGLLLFTNDGEVGHRLLHPSSEIEREYRAQVKGTPSPGTLRRLQSGVELDDGPARAEQVRLLRSDRDRGAIVSLVLREGRKREVRRLMAAVEHPVRRLRRVRFGPVVLGDLPRGSSRELTHDEVQSLRRVAGVRPKS